MNRHAGWDNQRIGAIEVGVPMQQADAGEVPNGAFNSIPFAEVVGIKSELGNQLGDADLNGMQHEDGEQDRGLIFSVLARRVGELAGRPVTLVVHGKYPFLCQPRGRSTAARGT